MLPNSMTATSTALFWRSAARMPSPTPTTTAIAIAVPPMASDTGNARATRSLTDQSA